MKLQVTPGRQITRHPVTAIVEQTRDTQRAVRELAAQAGELTGAVIRRGLLRIVEGGGLLVEGTRFLDPTGKTGPFPQFQWGALADDPAFNRPDGTRQMGWLAYRDDGTLAQAIAELRADDGQYAQAWLVFDKAGNIILAEDGNSGRGLSRPRLTWPTPAPTNLDDWLIHSPAAGATDWTSIARCEPVVENACMWWNVRTIVDAGVTAQYRWCFQLDAGVQAPVSRIHTLVGNDPNTGYRYGFWRETNVPLPSGVTVAQRCTVDLQVRMTAGADGAKVARASVIALGGDQS